MNYKTISDEITILAEPTIQEMGYFLVDVEYKPEGGNWILRLYIDKPGGRVDLDDCQKVSKSIEGLLANSELEARLLRESYLLEVSSPGADRVLKTDRELNHFKGRDVSVALKVPINHRSRVDGVLGETGAETLRLQLETGEILEIPRQQIKKVQLLLKF